MLFDVFIVSLVVAGAPAPAPAPAPAADVYLAMCAANEATVVAAVDNKGQLRRLIGDAVTPKELQALAQQLRGSVWHSVRGAADVTPHPAPLLRRVAAFPDDEGQAVDEGHPGKLVLGPCTEPGLVATTPLSAAANVPASPRDPGRAIERFARHVKRTVPANAITAQSYGLVTLIRFGAGDAGGAAAHGGFVGGLVDPGAVHVLANIAPGADAVASASVTLIDDVLSGPSSGVRVSVFGWAQSGSADGVDGIAIAATYDDRVRVVVLKTSEGGC